MVGVLNQNSDITGKKTYAASLDHIMIFCYYVFFYMSDFSKKCNKRSRTYQKLLKIKKKTT